MTRPLRVFLCHASQDKPAVRELYSSLKAEGWIDPWLDKTKILPGQDWEMVIEKAVDNSDVVIACLSSQSVTKEGFVQREIRYAYDMALEKPDDTIFLVPLRLDDCNVPRKLRSLHWVDYFGAEKKDAYSDLLEALKLRYEQKLDLEAEEIARSQVENLLQHKLGKLERKIPVETARREAKEKLEGETGFAPIPISRRNYDSYLIVPQAMFSIFILVLLTWGVYVILSSKTPQQSVDLPIATATIPSLQALLPDDLSTSTSIPFTPTTQPTETPIPTLVLDIGSTEISPKDGMVLLYVPAGEFLMGSEISLDEQPIHQVDLDAFWIDQTEVTNAMYTKCVAVNQCDPPNETSSKTRSSYYGNSEFDKYPVIYVSWNDALAYCSWADRRLPTEAEWEKAARGTDGRIYPWGDETPSNGLLNFNNNVDDTTQAGSYEAGESFYGAYDMAGNVWEWVNDWYSDTYYQSSFSSNPSGPTSGQYRALRGGSWYSDVSKVHSADRVRSIPTDTYYGVGFRCARSP